MLRNISKPMFHLRETFKGHGTLEFLAGITAIDVGHNFKEMFFEAKFATIRFLTVIHAILEYEGLIERNIRFGFRRKQVLLIGFPGLCCSYFFNAFNQLAAKDKFSAPEST